jgi:hypothetical protein
LAAPFLTTPQKGARTSLHLASSPDLAQVSGKYFKDGRETAPSRAAQDDAAARRLWEETQKIASSLA